ncbi:MAG: DUF1987 domain-containing protein [Cytophagales bacterium]|nr:MAG: DUF1987 domain-containing protein [Cytophagales bacterium]
MENLFIEGFEERPQVDFNANTGILEISESSYPEYTKEIYTPIVDWLTQYLATNGRKFTFNFRMDYFNTSTSSRFQKIIEQLNDYHTSKKGEVTINWFYEEGDTDMFEYGEDYSKDAKMPFNLISYPPKS